MYSGPLDDLVSQKYFVFDTFVSTFMPVIQIVCICKRSYVLITEHIAKTGKAQNKRQYIYNAKRRTVSTKIFITRHSTRNYILEIRQFHSILFFLLQSFRLYNSSQYILCVHTFVCLYVRERVCFGASIVRSLCMFVCIYGFVFVRGYSCVD